MSCRAALRRILHSIGSRAVAKDTRITFLTEPRRQLNTVSHSTGTPQEGSAYLLYRPEKTTFTNANQPNLRNNQDQIVIDLLSSIQAHLSGKRKDEWLEEKEFSSVSTKRNATTKRATKSRRDAVETFSRATQFTEISTAEHRHKRSEEQRPRRLTAQTPENSTEESSRPLETTSGSLSDEALLRKPALIHETKGLNTNVVDRSISEELDILEEKSKILPSFAGHDAVANESLPAEEDVEELHDTSASALDHSETAARYPTQALSTDKTDRDEAIEENIGDLQVFDTEGSPIKHDIKELSGLEIAMPTTKSALQDDAANVRDGRGRQVNKPPAPTSSEAIAREAARRARYESQELPRVPAQIMNEALKAVVLERKTQQTVHAPRENEAHLRTKHDFETFRPADEWSASLLTLESMTPKSEGAHTKRTEVHSLPEGLELRWLTNAHEAILEIMLNTGSLFQTQQLDQGSNIFDSFSFFGTMAQNKAARGFILEKDFFEIRRSTPEHHASLTMQRFMSDKRYWSFAENTASHQEPAHATGHDALDLLRASPSTNVTGQSKASPKLGPAWVSGFQKIALKPLVEAAIKRVVLAPLQLHAAVEYLTAAWSIGELRIVSSHFGDKHPNATIARALERLLTTPENVAATSSSTLVLAWSWLVGKKQLSVVRNIQAAHDELAARKPAGGFRAMNTAAFNQLLLSTALSHNVHMFRHTLNCMKACGVSADADSWVHFLLLTERQFAGQSDTVLMKMHEAGVLESTDIALQLVPRYATEALSRALATFPEGSELPADFIQSFFENMDQRLARQRWLTAYCASSMAEALLASGHWNEAFQVCERASHDKRPLRSHILNVFLDAAVGHGHMDAVMAVDVLQRFSNYLGHAEPRSIAEGSEVAVPRRSHLSLLPGTTTYEKLLDIATREHNWNLVRVIWQHACCSGNVSDVMKRRMRGSVKLYSTLTASRYFMKNDPVLFWNASWALHAVGVGHESISMVDAKHVPRTHFAPKGKFAVARIYSDLAACGKVFPVNSLAVDAREAVKVDLEWHKELKEVCLTMEEGLGVNKTMRRFAPLLTKLSTDYILVPVRSI